MFLVDSFATICYIALWQLNRKINKVNSDASMFCCYCFYIIKKLKSLKVFCSNARLHRLYLQCVLPYCSKYDSKCFSEHSQGKAALAYVGSTLSGLIIYLWLWHTNTPYHWAWLCDRAYNVINAVCLLYSGHVLTWFELCWCFSVS